MLNIPGYRKAMSDIDLEEEKPLTEFQDGEQVSSNVGLNKKGLYLSPSRPGSTLLIANFLFFVASLMLFTWSVVAIRAQALDGGRNILQESSFYSPMFAKIDLDPQVHQLNGSLLDMGNWIWRAPPSSEVDAAWDRIGSLAAHAISSSDIVKLGKDPSKVAKYPESMGLGDDAYAAEFDILHKIHCLNGIRRDVYFDHYFLEKYPDRVVPELHRVHTNHCLHYLLQSLMCDTNVDIVTQVWAETQIHPFPDFNINRQCRNFNALLQWQEENAVDSAGYAQMRMPKGHIPYSMTDEFKRLFGEDEEWGGRHP